MMEMQLLKIYGIYIFNADIKNRVSSLVFYYLQCAVYVISWRIISHYLFVLLNPTRNDIKSRVLPIWRN